MRQYLISIFLFPQFFLFSYQDLSSYYCGKDNCYKLLNVTQSVTNEEIRTSYRKLAKIYHPDKMRAKGQNDSTNYFQKINQAYEVLNNEEVRKTYDDYLANPTQNEYIQRYKFYKAKYGPQADPKIVIVAVLLFFSFGQFLIRRQMHQNAMQYAMNTIQFKEKLKEEIAEESKIKKHLSQKQ